MEQPVPLGTLHSSPQLDELVGVIRRRDDPPILNTRGNHDTSPLRGLRVLDPDASLANSVHDFLIQIAYHAQGESWISLSIKALDVSESYIVNPHVAEIGHFL